MAREVAGYTSSQLATIKDTVAADTNPREFDLFINAAQSYGLDPFRRQISAIVFNKDKPDKRRMAIIVGRDGLRAIAQRCGDYRPASERPEVVYNEELKGPTNPKGIEYIAVRLWKQDGKSADWFPVWGEAHWDEFAPVKDEWAWDQAAGKRQPTGNQTVDGTWAKMPIVMLTKCAEAQALRAGWPDQFSGLYVEEEMHQHTMKDVTPSEAVQQEEINRRENLLGDKGILLVMDDAGKMERVATGKVFDFCADFVSRAEPDEVYRWFERNKEPFRDFWAQSPSDALELKKLVESKVTKMKTDRDEEAS